MICFTPPRFAEGVCFTVAAQPAYEMGKQATELLLSRLAGGGPQAYQEIVLPVEIILRKSSGKPAVALSRKAR